MPNVFLPPSRLTSFRILFLKPVTTIRNNLRPLKVFKHITSTGKNNGFPFLDILGYLKNTPINPQIWQSETSPNQGIPNQVPWLGLVSLCQIWDFCGYSLNTLKYPKMGIRYFFLCSWSLVLYKVSTDLSLPVSMSAGNCFQDTRCPAVGNSHCTFTKIFLGIC